MTRCRDYRNIALFCNDDQIIKDDNLNIVGVNLPNIMHKEILQEFNSLNLKLIYNMLNHNLIFFY